MRHLLDRWPSDADLARDIGAPYTTVQAWRQRNSIPARRWPALLNAAKARGVPLTPDDLIAAAAEQSACA